MSTSIPEDGTDVTPAPDKDTTTPAAGEPAWLAEVRSLRQEIADLPGKMRATVTDEDKSSIAESVHNFFEGSGAFEPREQKSDAKDDESENNDAGEEQPPKKGGGLSGFAKRFAGEDN